jgi:hypothetical protein
MRQPEQSEHKAHRFVDRDGTKIDVVAISVIGTQTYLEFVRAGGRLVYRMKRPMFEVTFSPWGRPLSLDAANEHMEQTHIFGVPELPVAA